MMVRILICLLLLLTIRSYGQERNFKVIKDEGCENISNSFESVHQAWDLIRGTSFNTSERFNIRRKKGLREGSFHSCDNNTGYLLLLINEQKVIYESVPKDKWDNLTTSPDPEDYVLKEIEPFHSRLGD